MTKIIAIAILALSLSACMSNAELAKYECIEKGHAYMGGNFSHLPPCVAGDYRWKNSGYVLVAKDEK